MTWELNDMVSPPLWNYYDENNVRVGAVVESERYFAYLTASSADFKNWKLLEIVGNPFDLEVAKKTVEDALAARKP